MNGEVELRGLLADALSWVRGNLPHDNAGRPCPLPGDEDLIRRLRAALAVDGPAEPATNEIEDPCSSSVSAATNETSTNTEAAPVTVPGATAKAAAALASTPTTTDGAPDTPADDVAELRAYCEILRRVDGAFRSWLDEFTAAIPPGDPA